MPVEINELIIRANVVSSAPGNAAQAAPVSNEDNQKIQQMLDDIMQKLNDKNER